MRRWKLLVIYDELNLPVFAGSHVKDIAVPVSAAIAALGLFFDWSFSSCRRIGRRVSAPNDARHGQPGQRQGDRRHAGDDGALAGVAARGVARRGHCVVTPRVRRALGGSVRVELERGGSVLQDGSNGCFCKWEKFEEEVHRTHFSRGTAVKPTNLDSCFQASANLENAVNQAFSSFKRFSKVPYKEHSGTAEN